MGWWRLTLPTLGRGKVLICLDSHHSSFLGDDHSHWRPQIEFSWGLFLYVSCSIQYMYASENKTCRHVCNTDSKHVSKPLYVSVTYMQNQHNGAQLCQVTFDLPSPPCAVWVHLVCAFRYGRDDLDVIGLSYRKDIWIEQQQIYPPTGSKTPNTPMQDILLKKAGDQSYPFIFNVGPHSHHLVLFPLYGPGSPYLYIVSLVVISSWMEVDVLQLWVLCSVYDQENPHEHVKNIMNRWKIKTQNLRQDLCRSTNDLWRSTNDLCRSTNDLHRSRISTIHRCFVKPLGLQQKLMVSSLPIDSDAY